MWYCAMTGSIFDLSMKPDPEMAWIYDTRHPEYDTPRVRDLRARREHALASCDLRLRQQAIENDERREGEKRDAHRQGRQFPV